MTMKKLLLILFGMLPMATLYGQWYFYYMCGLGELQQQGGYATQAACAAAAAAMDHKPCDGGRTINMSRPGSCNRENYNCYCRGSDLPMSKTDNSYTGNLNFEGLNQGYGFFSANEGQAVQDWINDTELKNQLLGGNITNNNEFNNAYSNAVNQKYFDSSRKPVIPEPPRSPTPTDYSEEGLNKQMEDALKELDECTNEFCRMTAQKKYDQAYNAWIAKSQHKADQTLADLARKEYEKQLAEANTTGGAINWTGWIDWGIDAGAFVLSNSVKATSVAGMLAIVDLYLFAEFAHAWNNPSEYMGTDKYWGLDGSWKILQNAFTNAGTAIAIGNSARIAGTYLKGAAATGGVSQSLSIAERRILISGQKVLEAGTTGWEIGTLANRAYNLATE